MDRLAVTILDDTGRFHKITDPSFVEYANNIIMYIDLLRLSGETEGEVASIISLLLEDDYYNERV